MENEETKEKKYNFKKADSSDSHDDIASKIDSMPLEKIRNLDKQNPMEHAIKFDNVKKHMPRPGFMKVDVYEEETVKTDENGDEIDRETNIYSESEHEDKDGKITIKKIRHSPHFTVDLNTAIAANIAQVPMNVVPMLIDQAQDLVWEEKKTYKPEKRHDEINWLWIFLIFAMISGGVSILVLLSYLLR